MGEGQGEKARRRAARRLVGELHERELARLLEQVRDGFARFDAGEIDAFELDDLIHRYKRSARELWKFCALGPESVAWAIEDARGGARRSIGGRPASRAASGQRRLTPRLRARSRPPVDRPVALVDERGVDDLGLAEPVAAVAGMDVAADHQPWPDAFERRGHRGRSDVLVAAGSAGAVAVAARRRGGRACPGRPPPLPDVLSRRGARRAGGGRRRGRLGLLACLAGAWLTWRRVPLAPHSAFAR